MVKSKIPTNKITNKAKKANLFMSGSPITNKTVGSPRVSNKAVSNPMVSATNSKNVAPKITKSMMNTGGMMASLPKPKKATVTSSKNAFALFKKVNPTKKAKKAKKAKVNKLPKC